MTVPGFETFKRYLTGVPRVEDDSNRRSRAHIDLTKDYERSGSHRNGFDGDRGTMRRTDNSHGGHHRQQSRGNPIAPSHPDDWSQPGNTRAVVEVPTRHTESFSTRSAPANREKGGSAYKSRGSGMGSPYVVGTDTLNNRPGTSQLPVNKPNLVRPRPVPGAPHYPGQKEKPVLPSFVKHGHSAASASSPAPTTSPYFESERLNKGKGSIKIMGSAKPKDKGKGKAPQEVIDLDESEEDAIQQFGSQEGKGAGSSSRPDTTTSAQKVIPVGSTSRLIKTHENRGTQFRETPAQAAQDGSADEMDHLSSKRKAAKSSIVGQMQSKTAAKPVLTKGKEAKPAIRIVRNAIISLPVLYWVCDTTRYQHPNLQLVYHHDSKVIMLYDKSRPSSSEPIYEIPARSIIHMILPDTDYVQQSAFLEMRIEGVESRSSRRDETAVDHTVQIDRVNMEKQEWLKLHECLRQLGQKGENAGFYELRAINTVACTSLSEAARTRSVKVPLEKPAVKSKQSAAGEAAMKRKEEEARRREAEQRRAEKAVQHLQRQDSSSEVEEVQASVQPRPKAKPAVKSAPAELPPAKAGPSKPFSKKSHATAKNDSNAEDDGEAVVVQTSSTLNPGASRLRASSRSSSASLPDLSGVAPPRRNKARDAKGKGRAATNDDEDDEEMAAAMAAANWKKWEPEDEIALVYPRNAMGSVTITNGDINRLAPGEYLNDTLVEYGMKRVSAKLHEENPELSDQIHIFSSFFYKKLSTKDRKNGVDTYLSVKKWTNKFDIFKKKYIFLPINENFHWYLAIIVNPGWIIDPRAAKNVKPSAPPGKHTRQSKGGETLAPIDAENLHSANAKPKKKGKRTIPQSDDEEEVQRPEQDKHELEADPPVPSQERSPSVELPDKAASKDLKMSRESSASSSPSDSAVQGIEQALTTSADTADRLNDTIMEEVSKPASADGEATRLAEAAATATAFNEDKCYIITLDSLHGSHSPVYSNLKTYLKREAEDKLKMGENDIYINKENCQGTSAKVPHQHNFSDCGLYVMHFAEIFLRQWTEVLSFVGTERKSSQSDEAVNTLWDFAGAKSRREALFEEIKLESADYKIWKDAQDKAALEAKRKAREEKAAQLAAASAAASETTAPEAEMTELPDPRKESTEPEQDELESSSESGESDLEWTGYRSQSKPNSPKKRKTTRGKGAVSNGRALGDDELESQEAVTVAANRTKPASTSSSKPPSGVRTAGDSVHHTRKAVDAPSFYSSQSARRSASPGKRSPAVEVAAPTSPSKLAQGSSTSRNLSVAAGAEVSNQKRGSKQTSKELHTIDDDDDDSMDVDIPVPQNPPHPAHKVTKERVDGTSPRRSSRKAQHKPSRRMQADNAGIEPQQVSDSSEAGEEDSEDASEATESEASETEVKTTGTIRTKQAVHETTNGVSVLSVSPSRARRRSADKPDYRSFGDLSRTSSFPATPGPGASGYTADDSFIHDKVGPANEARPTLSDHELAHIKGNTALYEELGKKSSTSQENRRDRSSAPAEASIISSDSDSSKGTKEVTSVDNSKTAVSKSPRKPRKEGKRRRHSSLSTGPPGASQESDKQKHKKPRISPAKLGAPSTSAPKIRHNSNASSSRAPVDAQIIEDSDDEEEKRDRKQRERHAAIQQTLPFVPPSVRISASPTRSSQAQAVREPAFPPRSASNTESLQSRQSAPYSQTWSDHSNRTHIRFGTETL